MYTCRECENEINQATEVCPHCGADLTLPPPGEGEAPQTRSLGKTLLRWGVLLAVLLGAIWIFLLFIVAPRPGNSPERAEARALQALEQTRGALAAYASAQGGAYPASLEALGNAARQAAQSAQSEGYQLQYTAGLPGSDGVVRSFSLVARAGNYGYRSFYTDETGVVRTTREDRAATSQDPPL